MTSDEIGKAFGEIDALLVKLRGEFTETAIPRPGPFSFGTCDDVVGLPNLPVDRVLEDVRQWLNDIRQDRRFATIFGAPTPDAPTRP